MATRKSARLSALVNGNSGRASSLPPPPPSPARSPSRKRRAPDGADDVNGNSAARAPSPAPTTPQKRRTLKTPVTPVPSFPATPTPSAVGLISESSHPLEKPRHANVSRLADPNLTNAHLLSPESSRVIAPRPLPTLSKLPPGGFTSTSTLLEEACAHLVKVDARMKPLIDAHHCRIFSPEGLAEEIDPFESLCSGIISQQVSGAAARSIKAKFVSLFNDGDEEKDKHRFPHPSAVASTSLEKLRTAGLSQRKAEYVKGLAEKFVSGDLTAQFLADASYEEVEKELIAVRGLGKWSVEMFACFGLKRMDVFSLGDLGVQRGMAAFVGRDVGKLKAKGGGKWKYMSEKEMVEISQRFRPYRSLFMWYMWRVEETPTDVSTLE